MSSQKEKLAQSALVMRIVGYSVFLLPIGLFFYSAGIVWGGLPSGFPIICGAHPGSPYDGFHPYFWMLLGVYLSWAFLLIRGASNPLAAISLFDFGILSNVVHALMMIPMAFTYPNELAHLWADVPALLGISAVLWIWRPSTDTAQVQVPA